MQDALQQVLDFFNLLTDDSNPNVEWRLTLASTNSPLTVEGEPVDMRTYAGAFGAVKDRIKERLINAFGCAEMVARTLRKPSGLAHGANFALP